MKRGKRGYYLLLVNLSLGLLLLLSGCTLLPTSEPEEILSFDPNTATIYNPKTNISESFYVRNMNRSGSTFYHEDQMKIIVGVRDSKGLPGVAVNLHLRVIFDWYGNTDIVNLTEEFGLKMTTNQSGAVCLICTYNQYTWPQGSYTTEGILEISSSQLNNTRGSSGKLDFTYYHKEITRNSTVEGGIAVINALEKMNLIEEASLLGGEDNLYPNWNSQYYEYYDINQVILNQSTIEFYTNYRQQPRVEVYYVAWTILYEETNLTYNIIRNNWSTYIGEDYGSLLISDEYLGENWLITEPITKVNLTTGWLVMQILYIDSFQEPLNGWTRVVYQVSLVTIDMQLRWLLSSSFTAIA